MKARYLLVVSFVMIMVSCHKDPVVPMDPPTNAPAVKLKDMNVRSLPSPYYHFDYTDSGNIARAGFSGGLAVYDISYAGKDILKMENKAGNRDRLQYGYANGELSAIQIINENGTLYRQCILTYAASHQLQRLEWEVRDGNGFAPDQTMQFSYYPDGNLKELVNQFHPVGPQTASTSTDRFENYDDKVNADGFSLLQVDQNHHLILLPASGLQRNNPRRNIRTGDGINYQVNYTYTYDAAGRPLVKTGDLLLTNGSDNGKHIETHTDFSYYD
ncbi:MAG TPA: hypothetical protein VK563_15855 [Puia sp.]|nr:hypothetical protein [Puia sp.]